MLEQPLPQQFRAAKELLPYENAKLTAVAVGHFDENSFAAALERAILRSQRPPPPAALPPPEHPASELKGNLSDTQAQSSLMGQMLKASLELKIMTLCRGTA